MKYKEDESEVTQFFDELRETDKIYAAYSDRFGPLADFINEYEFLKGMNKITQAELAKRAGTTQSAISRFESIKHPPSYDLLVKLSKALGDELFISPAGSQSLSLPYDLREVAKSAAERRGVSVAELMAKLLRESLSREQFVLSKGATIQATMQAEFRVGTVKFTQGSYAGTTKPTNVKWMTVADGEIAV